MFIKQFTINAIDDHREVWVPMSNKELLHYQNPEKKQNDSGWVALASLMYFALDPNPYFLLSVNSGGFWTVHPTRIWFVQTPYVIVSPVLWGWRGQTSRLRHRTRVKCGFDCLIAYKQRTRLSRRNVPEICHLVLIYRSNRVFDVKVVNITYYQVLVYDVLIVDCSPRIVAYRLRV